MGNFITPNGNALRLVIRGDTNDAAMANAILSEDEYQLKGRRLSGWALDIGSHIGSVGLALAIDHPDLSVVCIEPVPDNVRIIWESAQANGIDDRVFIEEAGAGKGKGSTRCQYAYTAANNPDKGYVSQSRFIGNVFRADDEPEGTTIDVPTVTIAGLAQKYGVADFAFCKIDCEGCEYAFFAEGAERIAYIIGEWHDGPFSRIYELLDDTHEVTQVSSADDGSIGLFQAVRR
jgi:FkbM family methyltransferase